MAQIQLKLVLDSDKITYKVFLKSDQTYTGSKALITTSQITIVVPHGVGADKFIVENLNSPISNMKWKLTDRIDSPAENPEKDYLFFNFINNQSPFALFDIVANKEILLFSFTRKGNCTGLAYLVDTQKDAFATPNSKNVNIGINLSVVGAGGNAFKGNYDTPPQFEVVADNSSVCAGTKVNFKLNSNITNFDGTYQWFVNDQIQNKANSTTFSYEIPKNEQIQELRVSIKIEGKQSSSCDNFTTRLKTVVNVKALPKLEWEEKNEGCAVFPTKLKIKTTPYSTITWLKDNQPIVGVNTNEIPITESGKYSVKSQINGCENALDAIQIAGASSLEPLSVSAGNDTTVLAGEALRLNGSSIGGVKFEWSPQSNIQNINSLKPTVYPQSDITYILTAENQYGCKVSDDITISIIPKLLIPNAFTPNNDGINDTWKFENVNFYPEIVVKIYNRWGNLIYLSEGYQTAWNGILQSGQKIEIGTYSYEIFTKLKKYTGNLYVIY
jgi:gliding motility-associated-like protein